MDGKNDIVLTTYISPIQVAIAMGFSDTAFRHPRGDGSNDQDLQPAMTAMGTGYRVPGFWRKKLYANHGAGIYS